MAKAFFKCQCTASVEVGGRGTNRKEAARLAAWRQKKGDVCDTCLDKIRADQSAAAAEAAKELGLPALRGTEKQIVWAETIRARALPLVDQASVELMHEISCSVEDEPLSEITLIQIRDAVALLASELRAETDSGLWITRCNWGTYTDYVGEQLRKRMADLAPLAAVELTARAHAGNPVPCRHLRVN